MEGKFHEILDHYRSMGIEVEAEVIGERPCAGKVEAKAMQALVDRCSAAVQAAAGMDAVFSSGSTDANIPLSMGIPAACISVCSGGGCHTRGEWLDIGSLSAGCCLFMHLLVSYREN